MFFDTHTKLIIINMNPHFSVSCSVQFGMLMGTPCLIVASRFVDGCVYFFKVPDSAPTLSNQLAFAPSPSYWTASFGLLQARTPPYNLRAGDCPRQCDYFEAWNTESLNPAVQGKTGYSGGASGKGFMFWVTAFSNLTAQNLEETLQ